jgi:hypothetical protein
MDPSIWAPTESGVVQYFTPAGPPDGEGSVFELTIPRNPITPDPSNPNNFGTTLQFESNVENGSATLDVQHIGCPAGAPDTIPPYN